MGAAVGWGALAASSLVLGALLGLARKWPGRLVGLVLAFGAGALISAVAFELAEVGLQLGGASPVTIGLTAGALTYYFLDVTIDRKASRRPRRNGAGGDSDGGVALALGAFLDGIPEQLVLGIGLASGDGVGLGLLMAIFVSNLPEAVGSATDMRAAGQPPSLIVRLWVGVAVVCTLSTIAGFAIADAASESLRAGVDGFAAGALLVMLIDSMIPEASRKAGRTAGLVTTLGFAVSAGLSLVAN